MRPDFGSGLLAMVFEPNSTALAATSQMLIQGALQQHLGHLIAVQGVEVEAIDSTFRVEVRYSVLSDGTSALRQLRGAGRWRVIFHCCELRRLEVLRRSSTDKNAIEFLEVLDHAAPPGVEPQRTLFVRLLRAPPAPLDVGNVEHHGRRAHSHRAASNGWRWRTTCPPPPSRDWSTVSRSCRARW